MPSSWLRNERRTFGFRMHVWFALVLIPVAIVAALIAWLAFRYQLWRTGRSVNRNVWRP